MKFWSGCLSLCLLAACARGNASEVKCDELVSRSFPPNLNWIHFGEPDFNSHLFATFAPGQWVEYVLQIPAPGTYAIKVNAIGGSSAGMTQITVDGNKQGEPQDLFSASRAARTLDGGKYTFAKAGKAILRLQVTGKNAASQGFGIECESVSLDKTEGFNLICPNGARFDEGSAVLRWQDLGPNFQYVVYLDEAAQSPTKSAFLETHGLGMGAHEWYVVAEGNGAKQRSNRFHFTVGPAVPYADRDFSDDFEQGNLANYAVKGMSVAEAALQGKKALAGGAHSMAYVKDLHMGVWEGEVSALISLDEANSSASVGFTDADGARICAKCDSATGALSLERTARGYSIFAITPKRYQVKEWTESQTEDGAYVWRLSSTPAAVKTGTTYHLKLAYSRRSCAVMATLTDADGSNLVTLRDLTDINLPDHPMVEVGQGKARFGHLMYRRLNRGVYPWDIDTNQVVMRPGPPGSWDSRGVLNNAVLLKDNHWYMVYRGNAAPAPPSGPARSDLGVATSADGVHWTKDAANPIIKRTAEIGTIEDPDLLMPAGTNTYFLEYVMLGHQLKGREWMASSTDGIHYSEPWSLPVSGKIGGMIDTHTEPQIPEFEFKGEKYRYLGAIEEGGIYLSKDLHQWVKMGTADYKGHPDWWCDGYECAGDIFVDADHNLRVETQAGTKVNGKTRISGSRLCTNVEDVLSASDPTKVLSRGDLPWLPDFFGDAPTGDLNEMTFTNGSVFPGQTVVSDGYLWHYYGGNNTITGLIKAVYKPVFVYRDLHVVSPGGKAQSATLQVTVRNEGSLPGKVKVTPLMDGAELAGPSVSLGRDEETKVSFTVNAPNGRHCIAIDDLRVGVEGL